MLRLCDVVRAKFFMGPKQLKQLLAEGGPKPLPAHVAANALADTQRWRTDQAATGGIVPRPGMPASAGTVEAMRAGLTFGEPLPAGVSGLLTGSANAPMSVSSRAIAPTGTEDEDELIYRAIVPQPDIDKMRAAGPVKRDFPLLSSPELDQVR